MREVLNQLQAQEELFLRKQEQLKLRQVEREVMQRLTVEMFSLIQEQAVRLTER